ncbi:Nonribosomal peptide synthetase 1 [Fulvia fulva]|uniref:Nonribosomal peptide synthetase 1 n=1 Tax=Passalora fulva TaxID=5499 RepID=A0A9Q8UUM8_PASFU|nr:Nonribosomal peptide synthetase 1 [Fulvia fulva]KAK4626398.1 Nonribosomal peptide synthetase 1 [Fulvia fulva]KAK4627663.1 Nonribosomal peptide synthetase 1 [Fulvia fulva]UJO23096.1 Nonribosomal peptide synthetase 1 [Fulvia fulva]WPV14098.1 Nonribosomal peptide synthetase 1 [Fulvia fulva]WPV28492.1 Nonribosomal peptide synthetase 1 [Fulvia fulva]
MASDRLVETDVAEALAFGTCLTRFSIVRGQDQYRIVCRISHAQHDGMSMANLWTAFEELCSAAGPTKLSGNKHSFPLHMYALAMLDRPAAIGYWQGLLNKSSPARLRPRSTYQLNFDEGPSITSTILEQKMPSIDYTFATVLKAAWSTVLAKFCKNPDIIFGTLINGRSRAEAQEIFGPCINIIIVRMTIDKDWSVRDLLAAVNEQSISSMPFEDLGSRTVIRECTQWPKWSYFGSVVRHDNLDSEQSEQHQRRMHDGDLPEDPSVPDIDSVEVHIVSTPSGKNISLSVGFAANIVSEAVAHEIAEDLSLTIVRFYSDIDAPVVRDGQMPTTPPMPPTDSHHGSPREETIGGGEVDAMYKGSMELTIALDSAWRTVLGIENDRKPVVAESFFDLRGDLIGASALSAHMQAAGYSLPVEDVIRHPWFHSQVELLRKME